MMKMPWSGQNLRFAYIAFPPYTLPYRDSTGKERLHGYLGALLGNITESLNMTYTAVVPEDGVYGHVDVETGELHGTPRLVVDGKADIVVGPMIAQDEFFQQMHQFPPVAAAFTKTVFIFGFKDEYITTTPAFTEAVDVDIWLCLAGCAAILITLGVVFHGCIYPRREVPLILIFTRLIFSFFGILLEQVSSKPPHLSFDRLLRGVWMVGSMIFTFIFLGSLRANLIVLTPTERINTLDKFLTKPKMTIFYGHGTPASWIIETYPGSNGDKLREHFRNNRFEINPAADMFTVPLAEELIRSKGCFFCEERAIVRAISSWCVETKYFFHVMSERVSIVHGAMYSSKALPKELIRVLDKKVSWLQSFAVPFMTSREVLAGDLECIAGVDKKTSESVRTVVLQDVQTINVSLLIGLASSIVAFLVELIYHNLSRCWARS